MNRRKSTVAESTLSLMKSKKKKIQKTGRLRGKNLFRATVRLILENIDWLKEKLSSDSDSEDSMTKIKNINRKKSMDKQVLTNENRSFLLSQPQLRSKTDKLYLVSLIKNLKAFKKYPEDIRESIATVCSYLYLREGRIIVRQGDPARYLYFIIKGEVTLSKIEKNSMTGEEFEVTAGKMGPGDSFGEVALLHSLPRVMTIAAKTKVELLFITKSDFDRLLKENLMNNWNVLQEALVTFNYFKAWDETTIRECCVLSKIKDFTPNEILLGDGKGMVNYVYFLLSGKCRVIEHLLISQEKHLSYTKYKLYKPENLEKTGESPDQQAEKNKTGVVNTGGDEINKRESSESIESEEENEENSSKEIAHFQGQIIGEHVNAVTTMLQNVITQWHELTGIAEALLHKPARKIQYKYPENVKPIFMQVCEFTKGACFGIGEEMENRRIVSITPVRCLLIPRNWLLDHNRGNIWKRVKLFLDTKYPSRDELFKKFVANRRWIKYKKELVDNIIKNGKNIHNKTTIDDVPYSIRFNDT